MEEDKQEDSFTTNNDVDNNLKSTWPQVFPKPSQVHQLISNNSD